MQLDQLLLARGLLTDEQLDEARETAQQRGRSLGRVLIELGYVTEAGLVAILAEQLGLEFIDLSDASLDASAIALVPEATARRHSCIPVRIEDNKLVLAMADPANVVAVDDIRALTKRDVRTVVATKVDVQAAIDRYYRLDSAAESLVEEAAAAQMPRRRSRSRSVQCGGRGRADHQARQPADHAGGQRPGLGHPRRTAGARRCSSATAWTACFTRSCARPSRSRRA